MLLVLIVAAPAMRAESWSRFRGPNGSGVSNDNGFPAQFGPDRNLVWKTKVRPGKSSPVLTDKDVFLTAFDGEKLYTQCIERATGELSWERSIERQWKALTSNLNNPAAATPVTDGENVYVFFPDWGLLSYDASGNLRWKTPLGPFTNSEGLSSSPILADGLVILQIDQVADSYIAAFDSHSGRSVWKINRVESDSWATPLLYRAPGGGEMILTVGDRLFAAHDLKSGKRLFTSASMAGKVVASPVLEGDTVYAFGYNLEKTGSFDSQLSLDKDGDGRLSADEYEGNPFLTSLATVQGNRDGFVSREEWETNIGSYSGPSHMVAMRLTPGASEGVRVAEIWRYVKSFQGVVPSPLLYEGVLYLVKNGGILTSLEATTGRVLKQERLRDAIDPYSASPVAADGKIYIASENGRVSVLEPGASWRVIAVNNLSAAIYGTPALSNGRILIRASDFLYCFGR
jgi:outer membrane protein assembly factor BamB